MILWTVERALLARGVSRVIVATDDQRIHDVVIAAGYESMMTSSDHQSGSDRLAEVAAGLEDVDVIANVQGDEPFISPLTIERAIEALAANPEMSIATADEEITDAADVLSPDVVKVVTNDTGRALYFSRQPIPFPRDAVRRYGTLATALENDPDLLRTFRKHTGLYVYRTRVLREISEWPQSRLECVESLEQLRALERGVYIGVVPAASPSIGVDTPEDLERARVLLAEALCPTGSD